MQPFSEKTVKKFTMKKPSSIMSAFDKMMNAARKQAQTESKECETRQKCPNCKLSFTNEGALAQHSKFKHKNVGDKIKQTQIDFSKSSSSSTSSRKKRKSSKKRKLSPKKAATGNSKTRIRLTNEKKWSLVLELERLKREDPLNYRQFMMIFSKVQGCPVTKKRVGAWSADFPKLKFPFHCFKFLGANK
jgi:hypothetical protein